jgi:uncharacterized protein YkwD
MFRLRRSLPLLAVAAAIALGVSTSGAATTGDCTPGADWPAANAGFAADVLALVNQHRAELGLGPLVSSAALTGAAVWKARHMAEYTYMAHNDPAPPVSRSVGERLAACGYSAGGWGENIAYGYSTPEQVVAAWLASSGHRANIENSSFHAIGVGVAVTEGGVVYWAQDFGTSTGGGSPPLAPDPDPAPAPSQNPPSNDETSGAPSPNGAGGGTETILQPGSIEQDSPAETPSDPALENDPAEPAAEEPGAPGIELAALRVQAGKAKGSNPSNLEADDQHSLVVRSHAGRTAWRATFGVPDTSLVADSLTLTFRGASTLPCHETISIWSPEQQVWIPLDRRLLGKRETQVEHVIDTAVLEESHTVLVRVLCQRNDKRTFSTRTDLLTISA